MPSIIVKLGSGLAIIISAASAVLGTVNDNDVHNFDKTNNVADLALVAPGYMYEVIQNKISTSPTCWYEDSENNIYKEAGKNYEYYNILGENLPIPKIIGVIPGASADEFRVSISKEFYTTGLDVGFEATPDPTCEENAKNAHRNGSVICVVDKVKKSPETDDAIAVGFKPYAFMPGDSEFAVLCPVWARSDIFWTVKKHLIAVR